jgi:hypothetical protein
VFVLFGVQWVMPETVLDLFSSWQGSCGSRRTKMVWRVVPHCVFWCIWRERNTRHFEDIETSIPELKSRFFQLLFEWVKGLGIFSISSLVELLDYCIL